MTTITTLEHIAYDALSRLRGGSLGTLNADDLLLINQLKFDVNTLRAKLIREDLNKGKTITDNILQSLCCVDMILVDSSECPELPSECKIYRSENPIPNFVEGDYNDVILNVRNVDILSDNFSLLSMSRAVQQFKHPSRVKLKGGMAFFKNRYLYIINYSKYLKKVCIDGVFENPEEIFELESTCSDCCTEEQQRYPVSAWMIPIIIQIITESYGKAIQATDKVTNADLTLKSIISGGNQTSN
jgi:hypothetical protein